MPRPSTDPYAYGRLLGEVHVPARTAAAEVGQRPGACRSDEVLHHRRFDAGSFAALLDEFSGVSDTAARLAALAVDVDERLRCAGLADRVLLLAHGDFGPQQVLASPSGAVNAVVDWDFCRLDHAITDVAIATAPVRPTAARAAAMLAGYLEVAPLGAEDLELLPDMRRAFHLNNLAYQVVAWSLGTDITERLAVIDGRLARERWWGPTLLTAAAEAAGAKRSPAPLRRADEMKDLEVAQELADRAAVVAMHHFRRGVKVMAKADQSPVTEADEAVEILLGEALGEMRSDDATVGEELGATEPAARTWILDPIDGTSFFARGDPNWRIQIALMEEGRTTVALVDSPALGVRWHATAGGGAFETLRGDAPALRQLRVSTQDRLAAATVGVYPRDVGRRITVPTLPAPRSPLGLVELVRGEIDAFYVDCCQLWDHAPWVLLVQEAGGRFTDHDGGQSPARRGGLYSNARLHDRLRAAINAPD